MEPYKFLNIEAALIQFITGQVRVDAGVDIPSPRPGEYVQVNRVGGTADHITDHPMVTFYVWAASWPAAEELAALTRRRVQSLLRFGDIPIYRIREIGGLSRAPDPEDGNPRYQFTIEYKLRGSTVT